MRRYLPHAIENMRDVGGYPTSNNQTVAYRQIIRSNVPLNLTKTDIQHLKEIGINIRVDLRAEAEYLRKKSVFEDNKEFEVTHLPIQQGSEIPPSLEAVPLSYLSMLEEKENISKFCLSFSCNKISSSKKFSAHKSSQSKKARYLPFAFLMPVFLATLTPSFSLCITITFSFSFAIFSQTFAESSVEPSLIIMISI